MDEPVGFVNEAVDHANDALDLLSLPMLLWEPRLGEDVEALRVHEGRGQVDHGVPV